MRHIKESLDDFLEGIEFAGAAELEEPEAAAPWLGDPWRFDVQCVHCHHVYESHILYCPRCDSEEATPLA